MLVIVVFAALQVAAQPQQECKSAFGKTACGYHCMAAFGDVRCADHPDGECRAAFGEVACGFDCTAAFGKVRCAPEPGGVCKAAFGDVVCSEGAPTRGGWQGGGGPGGGYGGGGQDRWRGWRQDREALPPQECKSAYGKTVCGHHCVAAFGDVQCARTHLGACEVAFGKITCADPPRWVLADPDAPAMRCQTAYGKTACGYSCQAGYGEVRCADTPDGVCQAAFGKVSCSSTDGSRRWR